MSWELERADDEHLRVLAACWGVQPAAVVDRARVWVQSDWPADATGPRVVQLADRWLTVLDAPDATPAPWAHRMVGLRGLLRVPPPAPHDAARPRGTVRQPGATDPAETRTPARQLGPADLGAVAALHARVDAADLAAAGPSPATSLLCLGSHHGEELVAVAAVVATPAGPPEVSILVDPRARGHGLAHRLELQLVAAAAGRWTWLQHRTIDSDRASQALARRCGFRLVSREHLVRPA